MSIQITLDGKAWSLPKEFIQDKLSGSLLAEALTLDPEATTVPLDNPAVKSIVLDFLVNLAEGNEPFQHIPELIEADRYLNLTELLVYSDPLYDATQATGSMEEVLEEAIKQDKSWVVHYLKTHKACPSTDAHFLMAVCSNAVNVVTSYLREDIGSDIYEISLVRAVEFNCISIAKLLLSQPEINPSSHDNAALKAALRGYNYPLAELILTHPRFQPGVGQKHILDWAIVEVLDDAVVYLLAHPAINPAHDNNTAICVAFDEGDLQICQLILADPRVDPSVDDNMLLREALESTSHERVKLLVTDPRVKLTLELKAKLREFIFVTMADPTGCDSLLDYTT